jgi:hypothetical protein
VTTADSVQYYFANKKGGIRIQVPWFNECVRLLHGAYSSAHHVSDILMQEARLRSRSESFVQIFGLPDRA